MIVQDRLKCQVKFHENLFFLINLENCFIPGVILHLEAPPTIFKIYILLTLLIVLIVEVDKKIMFHDVLAMEYLMKNRKYTNTDYLLRIGILMIFFAIGLIICFIQNVFKMFSSHNDNDIYRVRKFRSRFWIPNSCRVSCTQVNMKQSIQTV